MRLKPYYLLFKDLIGGLLITLRTFFQRPVTVQYPREKVTLYPSFRGRHALVRDPLTGEARCVACLKCVQVCPSRCIEVEYEVNAETGARKMTSYTIEALRCIYCGYCEEVCPVGAVVLTEWFEYSVRKREDAFFTKEKLLQNWDQFVERYPEKVYTNKFWTLKGIPEVLKPAPKRESMSIKVKE